MQVIQGLSQPLLVPILRNKRPTVALFEAAPFKKIQQKAHGFLRRNWSRGMLCVGRQFAHHILKRFHILHIIGIYNM